MADHPPRSVKPDIRPELDVDEPTNPRIRMERKRTDLKLVAVVVAAVGTVFGAYRAVLSEAAAQTDAGMRVEAAELRAVDVRVQTLEKRFDRFDQKMDLILDAQRVPHWKRPPPLDGGEP